MNSLLRCDRGDEIIGMGSDTTDLVLSKASRRYIVPYADSPEYKTQLRKLLLHEKPDLVHFQNDLEIYEASKLRSDIVSTGTGLYMPSHDVISTCVNKYETQKKWSAEGIKVPRNILIRNERDLYGAFDKLGDDQGRIWLRASSIGGGGKGALPTNDPTFAKGWIDRYNGWDDFVAAEMLSPDTVTWLSIWYHGELVVAQTRVRKGWTHGNRSASGVTGVTKVGQTFSDPTVDGVAMDAIRVIDSEPHGIYGVDMAYDFSGFPNPTEINISRFFTTVLFFTEAGLNMPKIFKDIALHNEFPVLNRRVNPLPDGLLWLRGMDTLPQLTTENELNDSLLQLS